MELGGFMQDTVNNAEVFVLKRENGVFSHKRQCFNAEVCGYVIDTCKTAPGRWETSISKDGGPFTVKSRCTSEETARQWHEIWLEAIKQKCEKRANNG